jgi:hypothetical protein
MFAPPATERRTHLLPGWVVGHSSFHSPEIDRRDHHDTTDVHGWEEFSTFGESGVTVKYG